MESLYKYNKNILGMDTIIILIAYQLLITTERFFVNQLKLIINCNTHIDTVEQRIVKCYKKST